MKQKKAKFSDRLNRQLRNKDLYKKENTIEFSCGNCLNMFIFAYSKICFDKQDVRFTPEPECSRCGATEELIFSDYGQEQIENMIFKQKIKKC